MLTLSSLENLPWTFSGSASVSLASCMAVISAALASDNRVEQLDWQWVQWRNWGGDEEREWIFIRIFAITSLKTFAQRFYQSGLLAPKLFSQILIRTKKWTVFRASFSSMWVITSLSHRPTLVTIPIVFWRIWNLFHEKWIPSSGTLTDDFCHTDFCPPRYPLAPQWIRGLWKNWLGFKGLRLNYLSCVTKPNTYSLPKGCRSSPGAANFLFECLI